MAEFQTVIRERKRMCKQIGDCSKCPIIFLNNKSSFCTTFMSESPKDAERIIMQWASEHPIMTNGKKFEEVFGFTPYMKFRSYEDMRQWIESEYEGGDGNV